MNNKWIWVAVITFVVAAIYVVSRPDLPQVSLVKVSTGLVEKTVANTRAGTVKACKRSKMSLPIGGQIAQLYVHEGEQVEQGQLLISLWNQDRSAQVERSKAVLKTADKQQQSVCIAAASDSHEAQRLALLLDRTLVSSEQADRAIALSQSSAAACDAAKANTVQAQASQRVAEAALAQTYLHAPFAGTVAEVTGEVGEFSTPSPPGVPTPPAIDLLTANCHYISAPIDEVDASQISVGMPVRVTMDAFRSRSFAATVRRISTYVLDREKQARTVEVEAELLALEDRPTLLAGYSADMEIVIAKQEQALRVPTDLLVDERFVFVLNADNRIERRAVELGLANWHFTQIVSGLESGDAIVGNIGTKGVVEGAEVAVVDAP